MLKRTFSWYVFSWNTEPFLGFQLFNFVQPFLSFWKIKKLSILEAAQNVSNVSKSANKQIKEVKDAKRNKNVVIRPKAETRLAF